jgi:hypothetical protein
MAPANAVGRAVEEPTVQAIGATFCDASQLPAAGMPRHGFIGEGQEPPPSPDDGCVFLKRKQPLRSSGASTNHGYRVLVVIFSLHSQE